MNYTNWLSILITLLLLRHITQYPQIKGREFCFGLHFQSLDWLHGREAEGREAAYYGAQGAETRGNSREGDTPFPVMPLMTQLFQPDPTSE